MTRRRQLTLRRSTGAAACALLLLTALCLAADGPDPRPAFEVVSIKPNNGCQHNVDDVRVDIRPGYMEYSCNALKWIIEDAYGTYADGATHRTLRPDVEGVPKWGDWDAEDRFEVKAKAAAGTRVAMMQGPMSQRMLEERFKLKYHWEKREVPGYALTVSKKGAKLTPAGPDSCVELNLDKRQPLEPGQHLCRDSEWLPAPEGARAIQYFGAGTLELAYFLRYRLGRQVEDKTGLKERYNFRLEFAAEESESTVAPSLVTAVEQQLGLKLTSQKVFTDVLVIDHVERPSAN